MKLNLKKGFFRLTIVLSVAIGIILPFLFWYIDGVPKDALTLVIVASLAIFMLGVAITWITYLIIRYVILKILQVTIKAVLKVINFVKEGFEAENT